MHWNRKKNGNRKHQDSINIWGIIINLISKILKTLEDKITRFIDVAIVAIEYDRRTWLDRMNKLLLRVLVLKPRLMIVSVKDFLSNELEITWNFTAFRYRRQVQE